MTIKKNDDHPTLKVEDYGRTGCRAKRKTMRIEIKMKRGIGNLYGMGGLGGVLQACDNVAIIEGFSFELGKVLRLR